MHLGRICDSVSDPMNRLLDAVLYAIIGLGIGGLAATTLTPEDTCSTRFEIPERQCQP